MNFINVEPDNVRELITIAWGDVQYEGWSPDDLYLAIDNANKAKAGTWTIDDIWTALTYAIGLNQAISTKTGVDKLKKRHNTEALESFVKKHNIVARPPKAGEARAAITLSRLSIAFVNHYMRIRLDLGESLRTLPDYKGSLGAVWQDPIAAKVLYALDPSKKDEAIAILSAHAVLTNTGANLPTSIRLLENVTLIHPMMLEKIKRMKIPTTSESSSIKLSEIGVVSVEPKIVGMQLNLIRTAIGMKDAALPELITELQGSEALRSTLAAIETIKPETWGELAKVGVTKPR